MNDTSPTDSAADLRSSRLCGAIDYLAQKSGVYSGEGVNHEGEPFVADLNLKMIAAGNGAQISFRARDGELTFHEERTWIARDLLHDRIGLWTISNNTPGVLWLELRADGWAEGVERQFRFGVGDPKHLEGFREEISIDFMIDGTLEYRYAWGTPGEEFGPRSRATLHRQERELPSSWL